jgi:uncharacterized protein YjiS (DUF1127 family)
MPVSPFGFCPGAQAMTFAMEVSTPVAISARADNSRYLRPYSVTHWVKAAIRWRELRRQRRALLQLDDRMLADIGITRSQAFEQAKKSFWK